MDQDRIHLVVGAAGMIGGALARSLRSSSEKVVGADLWRDNLGSEKIFLNLSSDPSEWKLPQRIKTAYICAGITKLDDCRKDPVGSSRVNVAGTLNLVETLISKGAFIVFLSSNQVFHGTIPNIYAHQPQNPINEYGRQKAAVEKVLSQWPEQVAIVRLTKVVGPDSIFSGWAQSLRQGQPIRPFTDMVVSPVPLASVVSILRLIGDQQLGGIWQISGERDVSYCDAAMIGGKIMGVDLNLIRPWTIAEASLNLETNPAHTAMDTERLKQELGLVPPTIYFTLKQVSYGKRNAENFLFQDKIGSTFTVHKEI